MLASSHRQPGAESISAVCEGREVVVPTSTAFSATGCIDEVDHSPQGRAGVQLNPRQRARGAGPEERWMWRCESICDKGV